MSVYRKFDREPLNDVHAKPVRQRGSPGEAVDPRAPIAMPPRAPAGDEQRKSAPAVDPLPLTLDWAAKLPRDIRPMNLLRQFPRIANFMAAAWTDPAALRPYLEDLFVDRRGNRQGFPPDIMEELFALRVYYEDLHPATDRRWDDSMKHR